MNSINPLIFREYDIRGLVGSDLDDAGHSPKEGAPTPLYYSLCRLNAKCHVGRSRLTATRTPNSRGITPGSDAATAAPRGR